MNAKYLLIGLAAWMGVTYFQKSQAAARLNYIVQRVNIRFEGITPILEILIGIQNPTSQTLTVSSIIGDLRLNGNYMAQIYGYSRTVIQPHSVSPLAITARLSLTGLYGEVKDIISAITNGNFNALLNQVVSFKGVINAEGVNIPMAFDYKVL
jgi:LEA14-like dessication related protein